jgi:hypothetical protein
MTSTEKGRVFLFFGENLKTKIENQKKDEIRKSKSQTIFGFRLCNLEFV